MFIFAAFNAKIHTYLKLMFTSAFRTKFSKLSIPRTTFDLLGTRRKRCSKRHDVSPVPLSHGGKCNRNDSVYSPV